MIGILHRTNLLRRGVRRPAALLLGGGAFLSLAIVKAQQSDATASDAPVRLDFAAPSECADQGQFVERVRVRSDRIQFEPSAKNQLNLTIQGQGASYTGRVTFVGAELQSVSREITARSCDEVIDGLALVTVMVLDPDAIQRSESRPPASSSPALLPSLPSTRPQPSARPTASEPVRSRVEAGADAIVSSIAGPTPGLMWGYGVSAQFSWIRHCALSPHVRASLSHFSRDAYLARGGTANFALTDVTLSVCPFDPRVDRLHLRPCAVGTYGRLSAAGTKTFVPVTESHIWAEVGVQIETVWNPARHIEVFLAPTMALALKRYSFGFLPYEFHQVPRVIFSGTAGLGLQFE